MKINVILFLFGVFLFLSFGCKHEPLYPLSNLSVDSLRFKSISCNTDTAYFHNDIGPLIISNCAIKGCHDGNSGTSPKLTSYANIIKSVVPGQMDQSKLYKVLIKNGEERMPLPPMAAFTSAQLLLVGKWILQGAKDNGCSAGSGICDTTNVTFPVTISPIMQTYCLACHSTSNAVSAGGGYKLQTLTDFTAVAKTGLLMNSINQIAGISAMPKGSGKLSACNITKIKIMVRLVGGGTTTPPPVVTCSPDTVYFTNTLGPLIVSSCAMTGCHNGSGHSPTLVTYSNIRNQVTPGFPSLSRLYTVLSKSGEDAMPRPPVAPFTAAQKLIVSKWIQQGAKNNSCVDTNCDTTAVTYSSTITSIMATNCIGCHSSSGSSTTKLDSFTGVKASVTNGKLVGSIQHLSGFVAMPPGGTLSVCDIKKIKAWVNKGALNN